MIYLIIVTGLIICLYALLLIRFRRGWDSLPEINTLHITEKNVFISVVIPFRNEANNLEQLIQNLSQQRFSFHHLEVILVDDASSDKGNELLAQIQQFYYWLHVIKSSGIGKKQALRAGISAATGELIVTTDADCRFGRDWLQTISETYTRQNPDMLAMPVGMILQGEKPHEKFQQIDYLALQMITAGAFGINKPIICSGANLAFKKKSFIETSNAIPGPQYLSGDDVFLLSAFKNQSFKVIYLKSAQALVKTTPCDSIPEFLRQRMRWGGKSMAYTDPFARTTVFIMFGTNAYLAVLSVILFLSPAHIWLWPAAIFLKTMADWTLLKPGFGFFPGKAKPITILISELIYPFYILITGLGSLIFKEQWKDRTGK